MQTIQRPLNSISSMRKKSVKMFHQSNTSIYQYLSHNIISIKITRVSLYLICLFPCFIITLCCVTLNKHCAGKVFLLFCCCRFFLRIFFSLVFPDKHIPFLGFVMFDSLFSRKVGCQLQRQERWPQ